LQPAKSGSAAQSGGNERFADFHEKKPPCDPKRGPNFFFLVFRALRLWIPKAAHAQSFAGRPQMQALFLPAATKGLTRTGGCVTIPPKVHMLTMEWRAFP
jgi:hypothetical protein